MHIQHIYLQIQQLIDHFSKGRLRAFAKKIDVPQSSLHRNMVAKDTQKLLGYIPNILKAFPEVREAWLYTGQGEMLGLPRPSGVRSAKNQSGKLIGDLLFVALGWKNLLPEEIVERTGIPMDELQEILDSNRYPDFKILEALYLAYGITPAYFFHGNEKNMFEPQTQMEYVSFFLDRLSEYAPMDTDLQEWFNCDEEEAREYLEEYKLGKNNVKRYGLQKCIEKDLPTEPSLPEKWVDYFSKHTRLFSIPDGGPISPPLLQITKTEDCSLNQKIHDLESTIAALQKTIKKDEYTIEIQNELIEQLKGLPDNSGQNKETNSGPGIASGQ